MELTYKAIGLHLLFLYRLGRKTEALYWERLRREISEEANDYLKKAVKSYKRQCKRGGKKLPFHHQYATVVMRDNFLIYNKRNVEKWRT